MAACSPTTSPLKVVLNEIWAYGTPAILSIKAPRGSEHNEAARGSRLPALALILDIGEVVAPGVVTQRAAGADTGAPSGRATLAIHRLRVRRPPAD